MSLEEFLYFDAVFPFGLCSIPNIFTATADTLQWIDSPDDRCLHGSTFLDDFLIIRTPNHAQYLYYLQQLPSVFNHLHVPVAKDKLENSSMTLIFLGIELYTNSKKNAIQQENFAN